MNREEIAGSIELRLRALREEMASLQAARAALHNGDRSAAVGGASDTANGSGAGPGGVERSSARKPGASAPVRTRRTGAAAGGKRRAVRRASSEAVLAGRLEPVLLEHGELSSAAVARLVDADRGQVLGSLRKLEAGGRVVRVGQRRGTRWRAITDEERIQQRAAELEALSRRRPRS